MQVYCFNIADGAIVKCTYTSHNGWVSSVSWSPVNQYLFISGSYDTVMKLWDTRRLTILIISDSFHCLASILLDHLLIPEDDHITVFHRNFIG